MSTRHESTDGSHPRPPNLPSHAQFLGTDGENMDHYWSIYRQTDYVVSAEDVESHAIGETPCETLKEWCDHVEAKRGEWKELRLSTSIVDDLMDALEES